MRIRIRQQNKGRVEAEATRSVGHRKLLPPGAAISALFIGLPAVLFYGILFRHLVNVPDRDDYDILGFLNRVSQVPNAAAKLWLFLGWQHNEYKLFFLNGLSWGQFAVLGHVNFAQLCVLGDSAVLVLAFILWSMFLPGHKDLARRLALFVPVSWLLFQLVYWEALSSALAPVQNLWVIVFSLGAILCVLRPTRKAYIGGLVLYALAISASGNGFFVLPVGLVILAKRRQLARAGGLLGVTGVCIAAYAYHYDFMSSQVQPGASVFSEMRHFRPVFMIAFLGNAGTLASDSAFGVAACLALGTFLLALFGWLIWRGYIRRNPRVSSSVLFILLTAAGVSGLRSGFGVGESLSSRYAIYGTLLLILAWMAVAEEFLVRRSETMIINRAHMAMAVLTMALAFATDRAGTSNLAQREHELASGMYAFEHPATPGSTEGPVLGDDPNDAGFRAIAREILTDSIRLGVYQPPRL